MIVVFDKLGPVLHAEIDLGKRLIVFAGPNHSGKTHVAWTIYGLLDRLSVRGIKHWNSPNKFGKDLIASGTAGVPVSHLVAAVESTILQEVAKFADELGDYFVAPDEQYRGSSLSLEQSSPKESLLNPGYTIRIRTKGESFDLLEVEGSNDGLVRLSVTDSTWPVLGGSSVDQDLQGLDAEVAASSALGRFVGLVIRHVYGVMLGWERSPAIFPTERTAINLFARELASARVGLVDRFLQAVTDPEKAGETLSSTARRYAGPILDCIQVASDLGVLRRSTSSFKVLADDLEALLGGAVDVTDDGEIGFTLAEPGRPRVPFHISASVVKSLASLVFYFRHQAQAGATLVIDEPELNLHPDLQRKVARFLAKAVNAGFRIILSTHSDYVLREFSNLVRLGAAGERGNEVATALGYDPASTLKPELVGVWHFANGEAESLEITGDGFNLPSIEDVIGQQNMDTQQIEMAVGD